jgi:hypothetical protein
MRKMRGSRSMEDARLFNARARMMLVNHQDLNGA